MQNNLKPVIFVGLLIVLGFLTLLVRNSGNTDREFINRELMGILLEVKNVRRGNYVLTIKEYPTGNVVEYNLQISRFVEENMISPGDSISKPSNSGVVVFYKKLNGEYDKCCELTYHY
jgi:hypothetical protein